MNVTSANRLRVEKGFDSITVDEVSVDVGLAKTLLYQPFAYKEALAAVVIVRVPQRALQVRPAGKMPSLPAPNSRLMADPQFIELVMEVSETQGARIMQAPPDGAQTRALLPEVIVDTPLARTRDPAPGLLKTGERHKELQIVDRMLAACLDGLAARADRAAPPIQSSISLSLSKP